MSVVFVLQYSARTRDREVCLPILYVRLRERLRKFGANVSGDDGRRKQ
jgi:hypothetical protein